VHLTVQAEERTITSLHERARELQRQESELAAWLQDERGPPQHVDLPPATNVIVTFQGPGSTGGSPRAARPREARFVGGGNMFAAAFAGMQKDRRLLARSGSSSGRSGGAPSETGGPTAAPNGNIPRRAQGSEAGTPRSRPRGPTGL